MQTVKKVICCPSGEHHHAIVKKLTVFGWFKLCRICLKRNPFKRVFKCSECKMIYHRRCGKSKMVEASNDHVKNAVEKTAEVEEVCEVSVGRRQDAVVPAEYANSKTAVVTMMKILIGTITAEVEGVRGVSVEGRQNAVIPAENANQNTMAVMTTKIPMGTITVKARRGKQTAGRVVASRLCVGGNAVIDFHGVWRAIIEFLQAPSLLRWGDEMLAPMYRSLTVSVRPPVRIGRVTEISALEYFELLSNTEETKTIRKSVTVQSHSQPTRSTLTRADYLEMAATWDPVTFKRRRKNEAQRQIYSLTIYNSTMTHSFIGELFNRHVIIPKIMQYCIAYLICQQSEEPIECLCNLLRTSGKKLERWCSLNDIFANLKKLTSVKHISSRVRFMIQDIVELRRNKWLPRLGVDK